MAHGSNAVTDIVEQSARRFALIDAVPLVLALLAAALLGWGAALFLSPADARDVGLWSAALAMVAVVATVAWRLGATSRLRVARRVDRQLMLGETLSTAYELGDHDGNPVLRALGRRAETLAMQLDLRRLGTFGSKSMAIAGGFLAVAALVVAAGLLQPVQQAAAPAPIEAASETSAVTADALDTLAQLLADDAERTNSDYLAAVSHSVVELADQLQAGRPPEDIAAKLQALLDHARAGYEGQLPSWLLGGSNDLQTVLRDATSFADAKGHAALAREARAADPQQAGGLSADMYKLDPALLERSAADQPQSNNNDTSKLGGERDGAPDSGPMGGSDFAAERMESEQLEQAGALPIGAAAQSGKGESNIAGGGSQPLLNDAGYLQSMPDPTSEMALTAADPQQDGHIRVYMPASAEARDASGAAGNAEAYARQAAQAVDRQSVGGDAALVVSRYFNTTAAIADGTAP